MSRPQQPELRRSGRGQVDQREWQKKQEAREAPEDKGRRGRVPPDNQPEHHPEHEQDKPEGPPS